MVALYGLSVSGHFPEEYRADALKGGWGAMLLWATMVVAASAGFAAFLYAWQALPWYASVIGGGAVLLFAPLALQPMPDSFVNGRGALIVFCFGAALFAALMWQAIA
jgi:hypothetical protein